MATILIENLDKRKLEATDLSRTLLKHFEEHCIDWMHACGGKGRCTTCKCKVVAGIENFAAATLAEERYRKQGALKDDERLSCQAVATGDVVIRVPDEYKLPHLHYTA